jgi:hypothetical protein
MMMALDVVGTPDTSDSHCPFISRFQAFYKQNAATAQLQTSPRITNSASLGMMQEHMGCQGSFEETLVSLPHTGTTNKRIK